MYKLTVLILLYSLLGCSLIVDDTEKLDLASCDYISHSDYQEDYAFVVNFGCQNNYIHVYNLSDINYKCDITYQNQQFSTVVKPEYEFTTIVPTSAGIANYSYACQKEASGVDTLSSGLKYRYLNKEIELSFYNGDKTDLVCSIKNEHKELEVSQYSWSDWFDIDFSKNSYTCLKRQILEIYPISESKPFFESDII